MKNDSVLLYDALEKEISKILVGKHDIVRMLSIALLSDGHVILEGIPGVAKTLIAKCFSNALSLDFRRLQMTPDMLPADITGTFIFDTKKQNFTFKEGPVFTNVILADEINRAIPKTQSALLEAMQEKQVTVEGNTKLLPDPFIIIATQNPVEMRGTYPLPEAQLDRFMFRLIIDVPTIDEEIDIVNRNIEGLDFTKLNPISIERLSNARKHASKVEISNEIIRYIVKITDETRKVDNVILGASPRATVHMVSACKAAAALDGRNYVTPDDVKLLLFPVLNHRIIVNPDYLLRKTKPSEVFNYSAIEEIIDKAANSVKPPR